MMRWLRTSINEITYASEAIVDQHIQSLIRTSYKSLAIRQKESGFFNVKNHIIAEHKHVNQVLACFRDMVRGNIYIYDDVFN